jgi:hypothetical protein
LHRRLDVGTAAGTFQFTAGGQIVDAIKRLQQGLLMFNEAIAISWMQSIVFCNIEVHEFGDILPPANVAQFKIIVLTVKSGKPESSQLSPGKCLTVAAFAYTAFCFQFQSFARPQGNFAHLVPTVPALHNELLLPAKEGYIL